MVTSSVLLVFPALMAYAAATDLFTMTIPNRISLALLAGFIALTLTGHVGWAALTSHLSAAALVLLVCFSLFAAGCMGGGDAKLAAATALWLGFEPLLSYVVLASITGGILTIALLAIRALPLPSFILGWTWAARLHDRKTGIPYGIALAAAGLLVYPHSPVWRAVVA